ncbi:extracellular solute-binding protein [bacterium]|nr:extracellular solute-binding protein [bacterium]
MTKLFVIFLVTFSSLKTFADLTLYTDRPATTTQIIVNAFTAKTGIALNIVEMKSEEVLPRLQAEGVQTNGADVIFVKDLIYLNQINAGGFFQPYNSSLAQSVRPTMKSKNWTGITYRARTVIYNSLSVDPSSIQSYENLSGLCLRSSSSSYNQALVANFIADQGAARTQQILQGWMQNLATAPLSDDNAVISAVADGTCSMGVVNTYYVGRALAQDANLPIGITFVGLDGKGTHTNGSGAGISSASKQKDLANQLIEVMLSPEVQSQIVNVTFEFPANSQVTHPNSTVNSWMGFKMNATSWESLAPFINQSISTMKSVNYN